MNAYNYDCLESAAEFLEFLAGMDVIKGGVISDALIHRAQELRTILSDPREGRVGFEEYYEKNKDI